MTDGVPPRLFSGWDVVPFRSSSSSRPCSITADRRRLNPSHRRCGRSWCFPRLRRRSGDSALARGREPPLGVQVAALLAVPVLVLPPQATGDSLGLKGGGAWRRPADETIGSRVPASCWMWDGSDGVRPHRRDPTLGSCVCPRQDVSRPERPRDVRRNPVTLPTTGSTDGEATL